MILLISHGLLRLQTVYILSTMGFFLYNSQSKVMFFRTEGLKPKPNIY